MDYPDYRIFNNFIVCGQSPIFLVVLGNLRFIYCVVRFLVVLIWDLRLNPYALHICSVVLVPF